MRSDKKIILFGLVILAIIIIISLVSGIIKIEEKAIYVKKVNKPVLILFSSNENCSISPWELSSLGINETRWLNDTVLLIRAYVEINCARKIGNGTIFLENNTLILCYEVFCHMIDKNTELMADCICAHELNFVISNIQKGDYNFMLEPTFIKIFNY